MNNIHLYFFKKSFLLSKCHNIEKDLYIEHMRVSSLYSNIAHLMYLQYDFYLNRKGCPHIQVQCEFFIFIVLVQQFEIFSNGENRSVYAFVILSY